jgi:hypothetical protein
MDGENGMSRDPKAVKRYFAALAIKGLSKDVFYQLDKEINKVLNDVRDELWKSLAE